MTGTQIDPETVYRDEDLAGGLDISFQTLARAAVPASCDFAAWASRSSTWVSGSLNGWQRTPPPIAPADASETAENGPFGPTWAIPMPGRGSNLNRKQEQAGD